MTRAFPARIFQSIMAFFFFSVSAIISSGLELTTDVSANTLLAVQKPSVKQPQKTLPMDQVALQEKFQKVIISSLTLQKVPFKKFSWLASKEISQNVTAFPFSLEVGNRRIVSVVYLVNGRYLATSPLLDITNDYKPVPEIPPPTLLAMNISSSLFQLSDFPSSGKSGQITQVIEFGDDQCPTCRKWNRNEEEKVLKDPAIHFTYIPLPLVTIHHNALKAAIFEMCAFELKPSSFWTIHDLLNRRVELGSVDSKDLGSVLSGLVSSQSLPATKMNQCTTDQRPLATIERADNTLIQHTGIPSTPTFVIAGHVKSGYLTYEEIKKLLGQ
ncbi:MAG: thioredoxin domain-containing protein [Leptospirales bacterium]